MPLSDVVCNVPVRKMFLVLLLVVDIVDVAVVVGKSTWESWGVVVGRNRHLISTGQITVSGAEKKDKETSFGVEEEKRRFGRTLCFGPLARSLDLSA